MKEQNNPNNHPDNPNVKPFVEESYPSKDRPTTPPSGGWGDAEHDTELHRNLQPHSCPSNYNPDWGHYRREE